jgi:battenin
MRFQGSLLRSSGLSRSPCMLTRDVQVLTSEDSKRTEFVYKNVYQILSFCYQAGVFLSRSSLQIVQIKRVEILTIIQVRAARRRCGAHALTDRAGCQHGPVDSRRRVQVPSRVCAVSTHGFCGCPRWRIIRQHLLPGAKRQGALTKLHADSDVDIGASQSIPDKDREGCINVVAFFINFGITVGCAFILIMDNTFLASA